MIRQIMSQPSKFLTLAVAAAVFVAAFTVNVSSLEAQYDDTYSYSPSDYADTYSYSPSDYGGDTYSYGSNDYADTYSYSPDDFAGTYSYSPNDYVGTYSYDANDFADTYSYAPDNFAGTYSYSPDDFVGTYSYTPDDFASTYSYAPDEFASTYSYTPSYTYSISDDYDYGYDSIAYGGTPSYSYYGSSYGSYTYPYPTCSTCHPVHPPVYPPVIPQPQPLTGSCYANFSDAEVGDTITWSVSNVSGGQGNYSYSWSGTDGLSGSGSAISRSYSYAGIKNAAVTITSGNVSITRNCSTYVNNIYVPPTPPPHYHNPVVVYTNPSTYYPSTTYVNPTTYYPSTYQPAYSGVTLSQVPYTGLESNVKIALFTLALILWSAVVTYIVVIRRRAQLAPAMVSARDDMQRSAIQETLMEHDNVLNNLESFARSKNAIVSSDALAAIADIAGDDQKKAETLLSSLANQHSNGEGWATIDLGKVQAAIG